MNYEIKKYDTDLELKLDMDETHLTLKSEGENVTHLTLFDYSGSNEQLLVLDWFDDDYLKDIVEAMQLYLDNKAKAYDEKEKNKGITVKLFGES